MRFPMIEQLLDVREHLVGRQHALGEVQWDLISRIAYRSVQVNGINIIRPGTGLETYVDPLCLGHLSIRWLSILGDLWFRRT